MGLFKSKKKGVFSHSGPDYLTYVNWDDLQHRRTIMASLVRGVYVLERDRQKYRHGTKDALAPPWWEFFNFKLVDDGILKNGSSIFGAIFQFKPIVSATPNKEPSSSFMPASSASFTGLENAPQYVVAFRGTMLERKSILKDLFLDATILVHALHRNDCFHIAIDAVKKLIGADKSLSQTKVWMAGHSLGSAIAMLIVKNMVYDGYRPLETYLFNSPFPSPPIDSISSVKIVRDLLHLGDGMLRVGAAAVAEAISSEKHPIATNDRGMFDRLSQSGWTPYLFVNKADLICSGFIGYFERRKMMKAIGVDMIEALNMRVSRVSICASKLFGINTETLHVLPSAMMLTSSFRSFTDPFKNHGLDQWYDSKVKCHPELYVAEVTGSSAEPLTTS